MNKFQLISHHFIQASVWTLPVLTYRGLVTPYGNIYLGQH